MIQLKEYPMTKTVWTFRTRRFRVELQITPCEYYEYDGDDPDGETQRKLDAGEYVAFESRVFVYLDDQVVGVDYLGGSVYEEDRANEFFTAHRDPDPMNRNCSLMRAAGGANAAVCHYFPGMVAEAIADARSHLCNIPRLRCT
jgi:hypothetical protein